jgi:hypothetical protein
MQFGGVHQVAAVLGSGGGDAPGFDGAAECRLRSVQVAVPNIFST